jgi:hypothetical protein
MRLIPIYLWRTSMVCLLFPNYKDYFIRFSRLYFIDIRCVFYMFEGGGEYVCDEVGGGDNAGFYTIVWYWEGVTAN